MRLEAKEIKEAAEEITSGKSESPLKVSEENNLFTRFGDRDEFLPGSAADDLGGDSTCTDEPMQIGLVDVRALPASRDWFGNVRI